MKPLALAANLGFAGLNLGAWGKYRRALGRPRQAQTQLLDGYLKRNRDTAFGREHGFSSIASTEAYRERVPVRDYDDYAGYVEQIAAGEASVLTQEPVEVLEWSSGSTRAAKLIPFTATLRAEFRRAVGAWVSDLYAHAPGLMTGPAYWSISPAHDPAEVEGAQIPVGPLEDGQYLGGRMARLVEATLAVPGSVSRIRDVEVHRRVTLLHLLACNDLRLISVWHPTFLTLLMTELQRDWSGLLSDLASGLRVDSAGVEVAAQPVRARRLESIDPTRPGEIWPRLGLISCWTDGPARRSADALGALFPGVTVQPKGLLATEGVVSIPFGAYRPLAITSHFFEFVNEAGRAHGAWEVENDETYSVLLTTGGGLYRYALNDLVRVTGFAGETPCLEFVAKADHISDLRGEKLSQGFVQRVIDRVLVMHGISTDFAMLAPEEGPGGTHYILYIAADGVPPEHLEEDLEAELKGNPHYSHCVGLGQLNEARVVTVASDASQRYIRHLAAAGRRLGDIKPSPLSPLLDWSEVFDGAAPHAKRLA